MPRGVPNKPAAASSAAMHNPVHASARELHAADVPVPELPPMDESERGESIVLTDAQRLDKDYADALAFMEQPMTIRIEPSGDENAPIVVDCWVNGKGAEVMDPATGKWLELNCLPIGGAIVTKRKYVEVLARSRQEKVVGSEQNARPEPGKDGWQIKRSQVRKTLFSVIHDPDPRGADWLTRVLSER